MVNAGTSDKDLDLYFLSLDLSYALPDFEGLKTWLTFEFGELEDIMDLSYESSRTHYRAK